MTASNKQPPRAIPEQSGASKHAENSATSKPPAGKPATITFHKKLYSRRYTDLVPPHSEKQRVALRNSIEAAGKVLVPILVTEDDELLDGAHRLLDAAELGLPAKAVPFTVVKGLSDDKKRDLALSLNIHRRQLTQQQIRDLIESDLRRDPAQSDNLIATRYGVSHVTVGTRRRELEEGGQIDKVSQRRGRGGAMHNVPPKPQGKPAVQSHGTGTPAGARPSRSPRRASSSTTPRSRSASVSSTRPALPTL